KILGGDADVDNFLQQTYADPNDLEAIVIESRAKAVAHLFSDTFFNGDSTANPKAFDGLATLVPASQTLEPGPDGGALTLDLMDELIDLVRPGRPDALLMHKRTRRKLSQLRRTSGNLLETDVDAFGRRALFYDGIPIIVDDFIPTNDTRGAGSTLHSISAAKSGQPAVIGSANRRFLIDAMR